jgi:CD2 antigen cytoplasmic tail-binding protein 2
MSRKRVQFDLTPQENVKEIDPRDLQDLNDVDDEGEEEEDGEKLPFNKKFKHTLDSDEEDDEVNVEKYNFLTADQFQGEEEGTARVENAVKLTPFNMKEELEEGHFDKDGTYIFRKDSDQIRDNWLDNIDWVKVGDEPETADQEAGDDTVAPDNDDSEDDDDALIRDQVNVPQCLDSLLGYLQKGETVQRAIQRLGRNKLKAPQRLKLKGLQKKNKLSVAQQEELDEDERRTVELNKCIELADRLVSSGDMGVYEKTFEVISFAVEKEKKRFECAKQDDMFADDFETSGSASKSST